MATKYDKALSDLLTKFYTDSKVEEPVRRIVQEVINAEINQLESKRPRVIDDILAAIEEEAVTISKNNKK